MPGLEDLPPELRLDIFSRLCVPKHKIKIKADVADPQRGEASGWIMRVVKASPDHHHRKRYKETNAALRDYASLSLVTKQFRTEVEDAFWKDTWFTIFVEQRQSALLEPHHSRPTTPHLFENMRNMEILLNCRSWRTTVGRPEGCVLLKKNGDLAGIRWDVDRGLFQSRYSAPFSLAQYTKYCRETFSEECVKKRDRGVLRAEKTLNYGVMAIYRDGTKTKQEKLVEVFEKFAHLQRGRKDDERWR